MAIYREIRLMAKDILDVSAAARTELIIGLDRLHNHIAECSTCYTAFKNGNPRGACRMSGESMITVLMAYSRMKFLTGGDAERKRARKAMDDMRKSMGKPALTELDTVNPRQGRLW